MTAPSPGGVQRHRMLPIHFGNAVAMPVASPHPDGDWVRYGDIAGMVSENVRLRKALELAKPCISRAFHSMGCDVEEDMACNCVKSLAMEACAEALRGAAESSACEPTTAQLDAEIAENPVSPFAGCPRCFRDMQYCACSGAAGEVRQ